MARNWFFCLHCKAGFQVNSPMANSAVACPKCQTPIQPENRWYYARDKQKLGPFSLVQLRQLVANGLLRRGDMVLMEGAQKWVTARSIDGLFPGLLNSDRLAGFFKCLPPFTRATSALSGKVWAGIQKLRPLLSEHRRSLVISGIVVGLLSLLLVALTEHGNVNPDLVALNASKQKTGDEPQKPLTSPTPDNPAISNRPVTSDRPTNTPEPIAKLTAPNQIPKKAEMPVDPPKGALPPNLGLSGWQLAQLIMNGNSSPGKKDKTTTLDGEIKALEGIWIIESCVMWGKQSSSRDLIGQKLIITENNFAHIFPNIGEAGFTLSGSFTINPGVNPKEIDFNSNSDSSKCIYKAHGDGLIICSSAFTDQGRPKDFSSSKSNYQVLRGYKRQMNVFYPSEEKRFPKTQQEAKSFPSPQLGRPKTNTAENEIKSELLDHARFDKVNRFIYDLLKGAIRADEIELEIRKINILADEANYSPEKTFELLKRGVDQAHTLGLSNLQAVRSTQHSLAFAAAYMKMGR